MTCLTTTHGDRPSLILFNGQNWDAAPFLGKDGSHQESPCLPHPRGCVSRPVHCSEERELRAGPACALRERAIVKGQSDRKWAAGGGSRQPWGRPATGRSVWRLRVWKSWPALPRPPSSPRLPSPLLPLEQTPRSAPLEAQAGAFSSQPRSHGLASSVGTR